MAITETRIYGPAQPGTSTAVIYTVPAVTTAILKQIILANTTGSAATVTIGINGSDAEDRIIPSISVAANSVYTLDIALPLPTADTLDAFQGTSAAITVTISAYLIT